MANPLPTSVQRLRYFDGEYLRSYDFTDEQSYHIAMRRLMNQKLHLSGIVEGLEIVEDATSVPSANTYFYSISSGMAIDQTGREIVVPAPYSLTNILNQPGLSAGNGYEVWICYEENETTVPAAGYLDCNVKNQYTRWQESFQVQLVPAQGPVLLPACGGVRLGVVQVVSSPSGVGLAIGGAATPQTYNVKRHYVGIRAQEIIAPDKADQHPDPFDMTVTTTATTPLAAPTPFPPAGYLRIRPSSVEHGNLFVEKNVAIGTTFSIDTTDNNITISPPGDGNLIVSNDLFVQGNLYAYNPNAPNPKGMSSPAGAWWDLQQYTQSFDIQFGLAPVSIFPLASAASVSLSGSVSVTAPKSTLASVTNANVLLSIIEIDWQSAFILANWGTDTNPFTYSVSPDTSGGISNPLTFNIDWTVGPTVNPASGALSPITKLIVSYIVIYQP